MNDVIFLVIGLLLGILIGFFIGRSRREDHSEASDPTTLIGNMLSQMAELKGIFSELEKSRERLEQERLKTEQEREKRFNEFMNNTHRLLQEISNRSSKSDEEKEKRIRELMEQNRKFFEEQRANTEKFLIEQGKTREEIERKRDAQLSDMNRMIQTFTRTISGTKTRGIVGEEVLKGILNDSIRAEVVKCNLRTDNGEVEFAWDLEDGKYIPIDSKLPDVFELVNKYSNVDNLEEQKALKKEIVEKVRKEVKNVQKYQNLPNTIDRCILVVPEGVLDIAPELISFGKEFNVFICSYKDVFHIAHMIGEHYIYLKRQGDIGRYIQMINILYQTLDKISKKIDSINKAIETIKNASEEITDNIKIAKREDRYNTQDKPLQ